MSDYYLEVLVNRNVEKEKKKRKVAIISVMLILIVAGLITCWPAFYYISALCIFGYYVMVSNYYIEFEYFYMDGELSISKIYNKSRRKNIITINEGMIKLIVPVDAVELQEFNGLKKIDCTANEPLNSPYVLICEHNGKLEAVYIQMNNELFNEMKKNMPYKMKYHLNV